MKKVLILAVLFALPVTAYIFFSSAVHNFAHLPKLTGDVDSLENFESLRGDKLQLDGKITILSFYGKNIADMKGNAYNLNDEIYKKNFKYKNFQFIVLAEDGTQDEARHLIDQLKPTSNPVKWKFAFGSPEDIKSVFNSMETDLELGQDLSTPYTFIIDKNRNLRGRDKENTDDHQYVYGYDTRSPGKLVKVMSDDVDVLLAEYRLALKRKKDKIEKK